MMQLKIGGNFECLFDFPEDAKKFKVSLLSFFRKFKKDLSGVSHSKLLMSIIYNRGDEVIVQNPHQDYGFKQVMDTKEKLAWTANIPISQDGSYIFYGMVQGMVLQFTFLLVNVCCYEVMLSMLEVTLIGQALQVKIFCGCIFICQRALCLRIH